MEGAGCETEWEGSAGSRDEAEGGDWSWVMKYLVCHTGDLDVHGSRSQVPCPHLFAGRMKVEGLSLTNPRGRCWAGQPGQETGAGSLSLALLPIPFRASLIAQLVKNWPAMQETPVRFLGWEDPLEKG